MDEWLKKQKELIEKTVDKFGIPGHKVTGSWNDMDDSLREKLLESVQKYLEAQVAAFDKEFPKGSGW